MYQRRWSLWFGLSVLAGVAVLVQPTAALAKPAWQVEWERVMAAARKEGKIVLVADPGADERKAITKEWAKAYPDIKMVYIGARVSEVAPKIAYERKAGRFSYDAFIGYSKSMIKILRPVGALRDLTKGVWILPEVTDDSKWYGGLDYGYVDLDRKYVFNAFHSEQESMLLNRDFVSKKELSSEAVLDPNFLKDPKWANKIGWFDPRIGGQGQRTAYFLNLAMGDDWTRDLLQNQTILFTRKSVQLRDWFATGHTPIGIGVSGRALRALQREGVATNTESVFFKAAIGNLGSNGPQTALFTKAPHPNAAVVFMNWYHSQKFMEGYNKAVESNSRRLDVGQYNPVGQYDRSKPPEKYIKLTDEGHANKVDKKAVLWKQWIPQR